MKATHLRVPYLALRCPEMKAVRLRNRANRMSAFFQLQARDLRLRDRVQPARMQTQWQTISVMFATRRFRWHRATVYGILGSNLVYFFTSVGIAYASKGSFPLKIVQQCYVHYSVKILDVKIRRIQNKRRAACKHHKNKRPWTEINSMWFNAIVNEQMAKRVRHGYP